MPVPTVVAPIRMLSTVVTARRLLIRERPLLVAPFNLALSACSASLAGVLVGHNRTVETGCDSHACQVRRAGSRPWHTPPTPVGKPPQSGTEVPPPTRISGVRGSACQPFLQIRKFLAVPSHEPVGQQRYVFALYIRRQGKETH